MPCVLLRPMFGKMKEETTLLVWQLTQNVEFSQVCLFYTADKSAEDFILTEDVFKKNVVKYLL